MIVNPLDDATAGAAQDTAGDPLQPQEDRTMKKVALITVHGMGDTRSTYANGLWRDLKSRLGSRATQVALAPIYYQHLLQNSQQEVWRRVQRHGKVRYGDLRRFLLFGFGDAAGLETGKEFPGSTYERAQIEIAKAFLAARQAMGGDGPVVLVSQSLGCQVLSNYLYDAQRPPAHPARVGIWRDIAALAPQITGGPALTAQEIGFLRGGGLRRWLTTGCTIPVFVAAHQTMAVKPIQPPHADFQWLNIYDPDDVLGWPLGPLSADYKALVEDRAINAGRGLVDWVLKSWNPLSHTAYWEDGDVLAPLAEWLGSFTP
jgi:hypothetical protein